MSVINSNMAALRAAGKLQDNQSMLTRSLDRLSSGSKLNNAAEGPAEMAVSLKMDSRLQRIDAVEDNLANAMSFTQAQDGYLRKLGKVLDRMGELAVLAKDGLRSDADRELYNAEFQQLKAFVGDTASKQFNGVGLFEGAEVSVTQNAEGEVFKLNAIDLFREEYNNLWEGNTPELDANGDPVVNDEVSHLMTTEAADAVLAQIKVANEELGKDIAELGAVQSRISSTAENLAASKNNMQAANSRIKDVDVAEESTELAKYNILVQSGTAMLAQANQLPQNVLRLLQ